MTDTARATIIDMMERADTARDMARAKCLDPSGYDDAIVYYRAAQLLYTRINFVTSAARMVQERQRVEALQARAAMARGLLGDGT